MSALENGWTPSTREELLFILYAILSVLCFANEHQVIGWIFASKGSACLAASFYLAIKEAKKIKEYR